MTSVLTVNVGSSNVKLRLLDANDEALWGRTVDIGARDSTSETFRGFVAGAPVFDAVGHRVVHSGPHLRGAVHARDETVGYLRALEGLAPLHNAAALDLVDAGRAATAVPHVLCFDTTFHRDLPDDAAVYPVPWEWTEFGMRRYGFHGLSYAYATRRAAQLLERPAGELRLVICHLGSGASVAAVEAGVSVDTTMGVTPNEGLMMGSRSGSIDPGGLLWIMREQGLSPAEADELVERHAGLLGVSGVSSDISAVFAAADRGEQRGKLAIAIYVRRLRAGIAAMTAAMGGLDALVFTGGVGEHSPRVRDETCQGLGFLGVSLDAQANLEVASDRLISAADARVPTLVVHSREDIEIAAEVRQLLAADRGN